LFSSTGTAGSYRVFANSDEGWLFTGNGGQSGASYVLLPFTTAPLIFSTVAIPNLLRSRQAANETSAVASLRSIAVAERTYIRSQRNYGDLAALIRAGLLDSRFNAPVSGYQFSIAVTAGNFTAVANPVSSNTGRYGYLITSDGMVRYSAAAALAPPGQAGKPVQ
jgi:type II secretory pathway pseudopilin PulG